jgi:hypothetical protein
MEQEKKNNLFKSCYDYLQEPMSIYFINRENKNKFVDSLKMMDQYIKILEDNKNVQYGNLSIIEECINILTSILYQNRYDEQLKKFVSSYIFICYNINNNIFKNPAVSKKIEHLQRYIDNCLTFSEIIQSFHDATKRLNRWKEWVPPSFNLSEHYYNVLKEE